MPAPACNPAGGPSSAPPAQAREAGALLTLAGVDRDEYFQGMGGRILIIDDDPYFRELIRAPLVDRGWEVVDASTGAEATQLLRGQSFSLYVVDGLLPDISGMRWIEGRRIMGDRTVCTFVSAFWRDVASFRRLTQELAVKLVVHKPVIPSVFVAQVESLLGDRPVPVLATPAAPVAEQALQHLQDPLATSLPARVQALAASLGAAQHHDPATWDVLRTATEHVQKLKPSTDRVGLEALSQAVEALAKALARLRHGGGEPEGPWHEVDLAVPGGSQTVSPAPSWPAAIGRNRVLLVTDDASLVEPVRRLGMAQLMDMVFAQDAQDALALARLGHPDAVVVDIPRHDPGMAGQLAQELRSLPQCEDLPLAFLTPTGMSDATVEQQVAAVHAGASMVIQRPFGPETLTQAARQLVSLRQVEPPVILLLHPDLSLLEDARRLLQSAGMAVESLTDSEKLLDTLSDLHPHALVMDVLVGGRSGFDLCMMLRAQPQWQTLPVMFLTSVDTPATRAAAFQAGADDYLAKPIHPEEFMARLQARLQRARMVQGQSDRDSLTGLLTEHAFLERLGSRLAEAQRQKRPLTVGVLEIEGLRALVQQRGPREGDLILAQLGRLLGTRFRTEDLRARWRGDGFALAFPGGLSSALTGAVKRMLLEFPRSNPAAELSLSAGLASFPQDGQNVPDLLNMAAQRTRQARQSGGNQVVVSA